MVVAGHSVKRALTRSQATLYVCRSCRHQLSRTGLSIQQQRFASKGELPTTERVRRRLWGTDSPPGLADPYGGPSFIEKRRARRQAEREAAEGTTLIEEAAIPPKSTSGQAEHEFQTSSISDEPDDYVPAESWEGLEYVGSTGDWRDVPAQTGDLFLTWLDPSSNPATNREQLVSSLHQALVECLACNQEGLDPANVSHLGIAQAAIRQADAFASARINVSPAGRPGRVDWATDSQSEEVKNLFALADTSPGIDEAERHEVELEHDLNSVSAPAEVESDYVVQEPSFEPPKATALHYSVQDESFLRTHLHMEDSITFTILKRFSQISGHRIPDPIINSILSLEKPLSFLIDRLLDTKVQPKPKKIADILMNKPGLNSHGNVLIFPRRETSVDKEKELGRWKVIEKELQDRGLPALGTVKL